MIRPQSTYVLELEAADYFKLNLNQVKDLSAHIREMHHKMPSRALRGSVKLENKPMAKTIIRINKKTTPDSSKQLVGGLRTTGYCSKPLAGSKVCKPVEAKKKTVQTQTADHALKTPIDPSIYSPNASLQSLPSISSSASVSPSLVCPHLTLDDIINRQHTLTSPHTIGLCKKCRLEPPPNIESPLSPAFKPYSISQPTGLNRTTSPILKSGKALITTIKRRHSDEQVGGRGRRRLGGGMSYGDESLDYWIGPEELDRIHMSASLRNSVEYIRSNPTESARILRIYKNGEPYEKPLRLCIMRGQFMSLAHLLDHINSRIVIPSGARYLFHLGGQLVYSENELKHNSIYIVSGTRNFNFRANAIIKEEEEEEKLRRNKGSRGGSGQELSVVNRETGRVLQVKERSQSSRVVKKVSNSTTTNYIVPIPSKVKHFLLLTPPDTPKVMVNHDNIKSLAKMRTKTPEHRVVAVTKRPTSVRKPHPPPTKPKPKPVKEQPVKIKSPKRQPKQNLTNHSSEEVVQKKEKRNNNNHLTKPETLSKSSENLEVILKTNSGVKSKSIVRAKSELSDATGKRKKNVTFMDQESPKQTPVKKPLNSKPKQAIAKSKAPKTEPPSKTEVKKAKEDEAELDKLKEAEVSDEKEVKTVDDKKPVNEAVVDSTIIEKKETEEAQVKNEEGEDEWEYPGGRKSNVTPEERPISQMEADEVTSKSKVVTPSPSLSITGDSLKLSISLDEQKEGQSYRERQMKPVIGKPCHGTNLPASNFRLLWVNGININEQSATVSVENQQQASLSPQSTQQSNNSQVIHHQFKANDRFHNWFCYSSRYDELVYPSGCLVVLWLIAREEQRYYSGHSLNVTALALCSNDKEVAASAQVGSSCVHLWSLGKLETLRVVEDSQFVDLQLFSLSLRNSQEDGCELAVAGYANKRIKLINFFLDLRPTSPTRKNKLGEVQGKAGGGGGGGRVKERRASLTRAESVLKASRPLKANQLPLGILLASTVRGRLPGGHSEPMDDVIVSIGQQHLQVWFMDRKQRELKPIESKFTVGADLKMKDMLLDTLSCYARLAPGELVVGTSVGTINLIRMKFSETNTRKSNLASTGNKLESSSPQNCELELIPLYQLDGNHSITTLTRISRNTFVSCDAGLVIRLWRVERLKEVVSSQKESIVCQLIDSLKMPNDFGFICSIMATNRLKREPILELLLASSHNVFISANMLINEPNSGSMIVIYDGHESSVTGLVSDRLSLSSTALQADYFTCSLDCNICRWNGRSLVWKSILPSACACMAIHPTGFVLAVGSTDGTVYILDKISGLLISYFPLTPVCINCLAYSRDGALLAAGCANGSIFILPVYDRGLKYKKVSIFQSHHPVVSLQFSLDNKYILTSVTQGAYQELVLWDLPNFRYMCQNVRGTVDKIQWFDSICSGSEDVRAIWENKNLPLSHSSNHSNKPHSSGTIKPVTNLSCHRLVRQLQGDPKQQQQQQQLQNLVIACDTMGHVRLFQYPCYDNQQGFYEARVSSSAANCCRFLPPKNRATSGEVNFVSTSLDGFIFLWSTY